MTRAQAATLRVSPRISRYVMAICWATITEDAAARAFAQGFYDAAGSFLGLGEPVQVYLLVSSKK